MKNYYQLLEVEATASADEVKRAFRLQIARYHPDKVQHLGREFQDMAAERAAELTEAYRILSDATRRAEYDRLVGAAAGAAPTASTAPPSASAGAATGPERPASAPPTEQSFAEERGQRDAFVRKAALERFRRSLEQAIGDDFERPSVRGFDAAAIPKPRLFGRSRDPRLLARFVPSVDAAAIGDAWAAAAKWAAEARADVCVLLIGATLAPARELAEAIAVERRKTRAAKITLVPVDARDWSAHMPTDAPRLARTVLAELGRQH